MSSATQIWKLWQKTYAPQWARGLAIVAMVLGSVHLIQMAFHEVSFSSIENGFLYSILGLVVAANQQFGRSAKVIE